MSKPRIFIVHCEDNIRPTEYAMKIIDLIGCIPVLAEISPKLGRPVPSLVRGERDTCDYVLIIATPDAEDNGTFIASSSVSNEIGRTQEHPKFKDGNFLIIKEETVKLGAMVNETYQKFKMNDFSNIAISILLEFGANKLFKNVHEFPEYTEELTEIANIIQQLKYWKSKKHIIDETYKKAINEVIGNFLKKLLNGGEIK